jgi:hypothetical protein
MGAETRENTIPRRQQMLSWTPAEVAIADAVEAVERAGAHPLLTDAVILLQQAREKVADYIDATPAADPLRDDRCREYTALRALGLTPGQAASTALHRFPVSLAPVSGRAPEEERDR